MAQEPDKGELAKVFSALANPHRLRIYEMLFAGGLSTCCDRIEKYEPAVAQTDVVRLLGLAQSTLRTDAGGSRCRMTAQR